MPKVSVIMPNHNGGEYLHESIASVLKQTYTDFELIIVDDASTDNSVEIIKEYQSQDERIKTIFCEKNRHVAYAANQGLQCATGIYIGRMDSDDIWKPEKLEKQVEYLELHNGIGACFSRIHIIDDTSEIADEKYSGIYHMFNDATNKTAEEWARFFFFNGNCLCNPSGLARANALDEVGRLHNLAYVPGQDFEIWSRLVQKYPIYIMDEKLVYYRWTEQESKISSMSERGVSAFENVHMIMRSNYLERMNKEDFIRIFKSCFVNEDSKSDIEIECEKAFILLKCSEKTTGKINFFGLKKFESILNLPQGLETLEKKFGLELKKYYKQYRNRNFYSYSVDGELEKLQSEVNASRFEIEQIKAEIISLKNNCNDLQNKCTEEHAQKEIIFNTLQIKNKELDEKKWELEQIKLSLDEAQSLIKVEQNKNIEQSLALQKEKEYTAQLEKHVAAMENSLTWRMFKPLRAIINKMNER